MRRWGWQVLRGLMVVRHEAGRRRAPRTGTGAVMPQSERYRPQGRTRHGGAAWARGWGGSLARERWRRLALAGLVALLLGGCVVGTQEGAAKKDPAVFGVAGSTPANGDAPVSVATTVVDVAFTTELATSYSAFTAVAEQLAALLTFDDVTKPGAPLPVRYSMEYMASRLTLRLTLAQPLRWAHDYRLKLDAMFSDSTGTTLGRDVSISFSAEPLAFDGQVFADRVVDYAPFLPAGESNGAGYFIADAALGPPRGGKHVVSLGFDQHGCTKDADENTVCTEGGFIVLGFGDGTQPVCIVDGAGVDFTVVENAAASQVTSGVFTEAAYVEVADADGEFFRFPATPADPADIAKPSAWSGFAGINVYDPAKGKLGDQFDLSDVIAAFSLPPSFQACYVKIVDAGAGVLDAGFPAPFSKDKETGADIDAVLVTAGHSAPAPGLAP